MYLAPHLFGISAILLLPMLPRARETGGHKPMLGHKHLSELKVHHHHHHHDGSSASANSNGHAHKGK